MQNSIEISTDEVLRKYPIDSPEAVKQLFSINKRLYELHQETFEEALDVLLEKEISWKVNPTERVNYCEIKRQKQLHILLPDEAICSCKKFADLGRKY